MAAGEAHWQNGVVERRVGTIRELLSELLLEATFEGAELQTVVDRTCEANDKHGSYNGTSPNQWFLGRTRECVAEVMSAMDLYLACVASPSGHSHLHGDPDIARA